MSVEQRLRDGLSRNAETFQPETERRLTTVLTRSRRRTRIHWGASALAAAAAVLAVAVIGPQWLDRLGDAAGPAGPSTPTTSAAPSQALTGRYETTVSDDAAVVRDRALAGRWSMQLDPDGTMVVDAPDSYPGVLSAPFFEAGAGLFRTSVFQPDLCEGQGIGSYGWVRSGATVTFTVADDTCEGRVAVLTSSTWTQIG